MNYTFSNSPMTTVSHLTVHLMGGLGNQLFEIFVTIATARQRQMPFIFPYNNILTVGKPRLTYWFTLLNRLLPYTTFSNPTISNLELAQFDQYKENGFKYKPILISNTKNIRLYGYFQSYKYFENEYQYICDLINIREQIANVHVLYKNLFCDAETEVHTISMHFRLGDYLLNPQFHPIMPYEYYERALKHIISINPDITQKQIRVLYFCEAEDNNTVNGVIYKLQENEELKQCVFVKVDDTIVDYEQMLIMSNCHDNIIANSTFSWWGAYFNMNENKRVCYPCQWFGPSMDSDVSDLFPETWCKIEF